MHKKAIKLISLLFIFVFLVSYTNIIFADEITDAVDGKVGTTGVTSLFDLGNTILGLIQAVGLGVAVIATLVLAMKYMYNSPDEKAEIKKKLIPFVIGGFLVFGATSLVKIIEMFAGDLL